MEEKTLIRVLGPESSENNGGSGRGVDCNREIIGSKKGSAYRGWK